MSSEIKSALADDTPYSIEYGTVKSMLPKTFSEKHNPLYVGRNFTFYFRVMCNESASGTGNGIVERGVLLVLMLLLRKTKRMNLLTVILILTEITRKIRMMDIIIVTPILLPLMIKKMQKTSLRMIRKMVLLMVK